MSDKPKFLYRPAEWGAWFAATGRRRRKELAVDIDDSRTLASYKELGEVQTEANVIKRHFRWRKVYKAAYADFLEAGLMDGLMDKQAHKRARINAEKAVVDAFPADIKTTRAVRDAFTVYE